MATNKHGPDTWLEYPPSTAGSPSTRKFERSHNPPTPSFPPPPDRSFRLFARFWRSRERLCVKWVRSMLTTCCILLRNSFEPKPNSCALDTAVLSYENWLINKRMLAQDDRKQGWLVQKFGLRRLQRFDMIQAETLFSSPPSTRKGK